MIHVAFPTEGESWPIFIVRLQQVKKELVVIISGGKDTDLVAHEKQCQTLLKFLAERSKKTYIATPNSTLKLLAKSRELQTIDSSKNLKSLLKNHPQYNEALREFLPHIWKQQLRSKLQTMGLLSLPKIRIWSLLIISIIAFTFAIFKLLPTAEIIVTPRQESVIQTTNIFLVQTGAVLTDIPINVRSIDLIPIRVQLKKNISFTDVSKEFTGTSAKVQMKVFNNAKETYSLRAFSRVRNNAGIIFLLQEAINVNPGASQIVTAIAADTDVYNDIIGDRGNVPVDLRWDFIGLSEAERQFVYAQNTEEGSGGATNSRLVYNEKDVSLAEKKLQQALLSEASQQIDEEIELFNSTGNKVFTRLYYDELRTIYFSNFELGKNFLRQTIESVPITGMVEYTAYAYDRQYVLDILEQEIRNHVEPGKEILPDSVNINLLSTHVMEYSDDFKWIKLTVDLAASERAVLETLSPTGITFANHVRKIVAGEHIDDAKRVINNLPEVERAQVRLWPPWKKTLPEIPYNITFTINE